MKYVFLIFLVSCGSKSIHEKEHDEWMKLADSVSAKQKLLNNMIDSVDKNPNSIKDKQAFTDRFNKLIVEYDEQYNRVLKSY